LGFVDESGANTKMTRLRGRALEGQRVVGRIPQGHYQTTTLIAGVHLQGPCAPWLFEGAMDGEMFLAWVVQGLVPTLRKGDLVIRDNLATHKVQGVAEAIEQAGARLSYPDHELAKATGTAREKALSLRGRAQKGDPLALEIFDFRARALGLHVANLTLALDASIVIIGGGLMDPEATSTEFRERYLGLIKKSALDYVWPSQRGGIKIVPAALGDLSQAIGAALLSLYQSA